VKQVKQVKPMSQQTYTFGDIRCIVNTVPLAMHLPLKTAHKSQSDQMKEHHDKLAFDTLKSSFPNLVNQMMSLEIRQNFK
jgi:hypothetical protein